MQEAISSKEEALYDCVQSLIAAEPRAKEYYLSLSEQEQGQMILHADSICSYERMQNFVNHLRG
ncbi:MAG: hypothetical protein KH319_06815 [Butyricicoccus pullicaecorum]|jgi:hypothetical protein|nr:hypothetical protein [Butyricicoccus pullicaecorum]